jgi:H+-translocating NAD(P) transhydrogenase subunit alpha
MRICVPAESSPGERRVAITPDVVARLKGAGFAVVMERSAGAGAGFSDESYTAAGAGFADSFEAAADGAAMVVKVLPPTSAEIVTIPSGATLVSLLQPGRNPELIAALKERGIAALALELVPRITRAQSMDVLSSQSTVAGYKAVLVGAAALDKFLPMLTTAAGNIPPAKAFVIGAGVAGLQAIATARRLGAMVSAFDVRPAAAEQVQSLGATFVAAELVSPGAEAAGGYARAQSDEERDRTLAAIAGHIPAMDLVVTTAQLPGRAAPRLITAEMVRTMRPGSVIVDLAAETGGNCELTRVGEIVDAHGVQIIGARDLAATVPYHSSQMFARNVHALLGEIVRDGALDLTGEIAAPMVVTN